MRRRMLAVLARAGQAAALATVFLGAATVSTGLHSNTAVARRVVSRAAERILAALFEGVIVLQGIDRTEIGPITKVHVARIDVLDGDGRVVLTAKDVAAKLDLARLLRALVVTGAPDVAIDDARIADAEVVLDEDIVGGLRLAHAFRPRVPPPPPAPPGAPPPPSGALPPPPSPRVRIAGARIDHAWVHGDFVPPALDGDVRSVRADVSLDGEVVRVALGGAEVEARAPRLPAQTLPFTGTAKGSLEVSTATGTLRGSAELEAETGPLPVVASVRIDGERVEAVVDVPRSEPDVVARAFPPVVLHAPASLHARASGSWPALGVEARLTLGDGSVTATGDLDIREALTFRVEADAEKVDLRALGGPASTLGGRLTGSGALQQDTVFGTFRFVGTDGVLAGEAFPAVVADGRFENRTVSVTARASEPGVQASATVVVDVPTEAATFDVQLRADDLRAVKRLRGAFAGAASARASGKIDLARGAITSAVTASGERLSDGTASVATAQATAFVAGPLTAPVADVRFEATGVRFAAGDKAPLAYPSVEGSARVSLVPVPTLVAAEVRTTAEGAPLTARADRVVLAPGGVRLEGARVTGVGAPLELDVDMRGRAFRVRVRGDDVDLDRVAAATGFTTLRAVAPRARATVDVDLSSDGARTDGRVDVRLRSADGLEADLHATVDAGRARGSARAALAPFGEVRARRFDVDLAGPLGPETLERATGELELDGRVDLAQGAAMLAGEGVQQVGGTLELSAQVERATPRGKPVGRATLRTTGLSATLDVGGETTSLSGVDALAHLEWDGLTDDTEVSGLAWDARGALATGSAKMRVPLLSWLTGAARTDRWALAALWVEGRLDVPERALDRMPRWLVPERFDGAVSATVTTTGQLGNPRAAALVRARGLRDRQRARSNPSFRPVDGSLDVRWDGTDVVAVLVADAAARRGGATRAREADVPARRSGSLRGLVLARASARTLLLTGEDPTWRASAEVDLDSVDLAPLPLPYNARGTITGRFSVRDVHGTPAFTGRAHLDELTLSNAPIGSGDVSIGARDGSLFGAVQLKQAQGGSLDVQVASQALGVSGLGVAWNDEAPTRVDYAVRGVRLSVFRPIVRRLIPEIDGRVDGRGSVEIARDSQRFDGGIVVSDGRLYVNTLGEEITDVSAVAYFEPSGLFRVQDARGRVGAGELRAAVIGRMKGLHFHAANASVVIPSKRGIPLSSEAATFAEATGQVNVQASMNEDRSVLLLAVDVPTARVSIPERQTQLLQTLDLDESIAIGRGRGEAFVPLTGRQLAGVAGARRVASRRVAGGGTTGTAAEDRSLALRSTITLGKDVQVEGRGMTLYASGRAVVDIADELTVAGRVELSSGTIDVQGRRFTLDRGTITFDEKDKPSNPSILASAYWDAPEGTRVWAEFTGTVETGELTLRSEPPYSKNEILSLLLFGRPEGNVAAAQRATASSAGGATGVAGGIVSTGLNRAFDELAGSELEIQANVATTRFQQSRPEVNVRHKNIGVTVGYVVGQASQIQPDRTIVTVDWQFRPRWSLAATAGDRATTILDVVYRYRY